MEIVGYAHIDRDATTGVSAVPISNFTNRPCRVIEFAKDGGVLVIDPGATGLATFDACDVSASFKCSDFLDVICDPNLNMFEQMLYVTKAKNRTGGYNHMVKHLVIAASLHRRQFCDSLLWQKQ